MWSRSKEFPARKLRYSLADFCRTVSFFAPVGEQEKLKRQERLAGLRRWSLSWAGLSHNAACPRSGACSARGRNALPMWVAGIDGCHGGWACFKVERASLSNSEKGQDRESKEPLRRRATYSGHSGFHGMHERAKLAGGKLEVWSKLDSGTRRPSPPIRSSRLVRINFPPILL
jgi:hypothetical protein